MSTIPVTSTLQPIAAQAWFEEHHAELLSRARNLAGRCPRRQRDDAAAEIMGLSWRTLLSAAAHDWLALVSPFTLTMFAARAYLSGRRLTGVNSRDVLSAAAQQRHGLRILSLDLPQRIHTRDGHEYLPLSEILSSRRESDPREACRQDVDYAEMLRRQKASRKARRVFTYLAQTHGEGRGVDIARRLRVSPPRIVQLKRQLGRCLTAEGYEPPGVRRSDDARPKRGRPRRYAPPLNAGTSPAWGSRRQAGRRRKGRHVAKRGTPRGIPS